MEILEKDADFWRIRGILEWDTDLGEGMQTVCLEQGRSLQNSCGLFPAAVPTVQVRDEARRRALAKALM